MTIDQGVYLAYAPSASPEVRLSSISFDGEVRFSLNRIQPKQVGDWGNFARGAAMALTASTSLAQGIVGVTAGSFSEVGLSSSASIGLAYLLALEDVNGLAVSAPENIRLDQVIENAYLGLSNGILDQSAILLSKKACLTVIDCLAFAQCSAQNPIPEAESPEAFGIRLVPQSTSLRPFVILLAFSGLTQSLVNTAYNQRVDECAQAAATLLQAVGRPEKAAVLGHLTCQEYLANRSLLSGPPAKRAEHFFSEMNRVRQGLRAWQQGNLAAFGRLMTESCQSSIHNYECGSPPLIALYHILLQTDGVYGARFSGAGFRGCCVALAEPESVRPALAQIQKSYAEKQPQLAPKATIVLCQPDDGARIL
jgi:galacturonokinase